jgi:hypothetical protein
VEILCVYGGYGAVLTYSLLLAMYLVLSRPVLSCVLGALEAHFDVL